MSLKKLLKNDIVNPAIVNRGEILHKFAVVTKTDEANNLCSIRYVDKDGVVSNKDNVPVRIYNPGIQDWFPEVNEVVTIEEIDGIPIITGVPEEAYAVNSLGETILANDILSDNLSTETEGGYIY